MAAGALTRVYQAMRRVGVSRVSRFLVGIGSFAAALAILYAHLVLWPQEFRIGQVVPYTIFSPVSFVFEDKQLLAKMTGATAEGGVQWAVDLTVKQAALANLEKFRQAFLGLRQEYIQRGATANALDQKAADMADTYNVDLLVVNRLLQLSDRQLGLAFGGAAGRLASEMDGVVTETLIRQLRQGSPAEAVQDPSLLYTYFLRANLHHFQAPDLSDQARRSASIAVAKGSVVIAEGQAVDARIADELSQLEPYFREQQFLRFTGIGLLLLVALLLWHQYATRYATRLLARPGIVAQIGVLFTGFLTMGLLIGRLPFNYFYYGVAFAVAAGAILVVLVHDAQFGIYFGLGLAFVLSLALGFGANLMLYTMVGACLPTVMLSSARQRRNLVLFSLLLGLVNVVLAATVILVSVQTLHWEVFLIAFASGFGAAVFALGLLPVIETLASQLTPGKLVELANPENDLLKRLKREAHGTYAHSVMLGDLAEEACRAIDADWLLAKVGGLYHDIGKLKRPGFFAENIHDLSKNPHQGLPPETSMRILRDHVADGLAMAKEGRLPRELLPFIAEHHGTSLIKYFYYQALSAYEANPNGRPAPEEADFCYGGPLPASRESGVVMLADITEAILRAAGDAEGEEVRRLLAGIVSEKIPEGQLVKSGLTLGDLELVKEAFARILIAQRHHRVTYPGKALTGLRLHFHGRDLPHAPGAE